MSRFAWAQSYPSRPVRIIVGFPAGGAPDILARALGQWLSGRLGQPFIIDNRPGAGSNIGTESVVTAAADGYTLLMAHVGNAINATLYDKLNFNFIRDIAPVASVVTQPQIMLLHPSVPAKTVLEFIAYAKANPGKISMASPGVGTGPHLAGEMFKMMTGVDMVHVPYRGGAPALADLLGGQVQIMFFGPIGSIEYIKAGKLRPLAVTAKTRIEALSGIPTVDDFVPGYQSNSWFGVCAPGNTPVAIVDKLNTEINAGLADAAMKARLADLGGTPLPGSPAGFRKFIAAEIEKWGKVVAQPQSSRSEYSQPRNHAGEAKGHYPSRPRCRSARSSTSSSTTTPRTSIPRFVPGSSAIRASSSTTRQPRPPGSTPLKASSPSSANGA